MKKLSLSNEAFGRSLINGIERALMVWHKVSIYSIKNVRNTLVSSAFYESTS